MPTLFWNPALPLADRHSERQPHAGGDPEFIHSESPNWDESLSDYRPPRVAAVWPLSAQTTFQALTTGRQSSSKQNCRDCRTASSWFRSCCTHAFTLTGELAGKKVCPGATCDPQGPHPRVGPTSLPGPTGSDTGLLSRSHWGQ